MHPAFGGTNARSTLKSCPLIGWRSPGRQQQRTWLSSSFSHDAPSLVFGVMGLMMRYKFAAWLALFTCMGSVANMSKQVREFCWTLLQSRSLGAGDGFEASILRRAVSVATVCIVSLPPLQICCDGTRHELFYSGQSNLTSARPSGAPSSQLPSTRVLCRPFTSA